MSSPEDTEAQMTERSVHADRFDGPLVSVLVINYNYANYIEAAVASIYAQSYPNIECLIIDDVSTDSSRDVIEGLRAKHGDIRIVYRETNGGQSATVLTGIENATGDYIVVLDADDVLSDDAVRYHIWAHLSLRLPVGFTSGDMIQFIDNRIVTAGAPYFAAFFNAEVANTAGLTRPINASFLTGADRTALDDLGLLCYVHPTKSAGWHWSPTSANCFRRDALRMFCENPRFPQLRTYTDSYLMHGIAATVGSALINRPLAYYRLHGSNLFARTANLNRTRTYDQAVAKRWSDAAMSTLIDYLFDEAQSFLDRLEAENFFVEAIDTIDHVYPRIFVSGLSYATYKVARCWERLLPLIGEERLRYWLIRKCDVPRSHPVWMNNKFGRMVFYRMFLPKVRQRADALGERPIAV